MPKKLTKLCLLALLAMPSYAASDVVVTRRVEADELILSGRRGDRPECPSQVSKPRTGDLVTLSARLGMARRDERGLSFIVRIKDQKAYILHHSTRTFSKLRFPAPVKDLETPFRATMGASAEEFFSYSAEGELRITNAKTSDREVSKRALVVSSAILRRRDVAVDVAPDATLGRAAFAVESLSQAVRSAGEEWMSLIGSPDGVPLSIRETIHQLSSLVDYKEVFSSLETQELGPGLFAPPDDYAKVGHVPGCFWAAH